MSRQLHAKHDEYRRKKLRVFRSICEAAFEHINMDNVNSNASSEDDSDSDKTPTKPDQPSPEVVKGPSTNKMMSNLYDKTANGKPDPVAVAQETKPVVKPQTKPEPRQPTTKPETKPAPEKKPTKEEATSAPSENGIKKVETPVKETIDLVESEDEKPANPVVAKLSSSSKTPSRAASPAPSVSSSVKKPVKKIRKQIDVVESNVNFSHIGGLNRILIQVCKLLIHLKHPEVYQRVGVTPPRGFLLHGPPGCGKTLLANAIAGQLKLPLIKLAATEIVSGVSGESESKLRDLFDQAMQTAPCVLFIDEIDAITQRRENAQKGMESRIVGQLLACMDNLNSQGNEREGQVVVIGATNRPDSLDPALRRAGRFEREIAMGIPDEESRLEILKVLTTELNLEQGFDLKILARNCPGFVGADLNSLCREAAIVAINRIFNALATTSESNLDIGQELQELLKWLDNTDTLSDETLSKVCIKMGDFDQALRVVQPSAKREGFATVPDVSWDDIGALDNLREELELSILAPVNHPEVTKALGMEAPTGILLCGPPGCGKTLLAKAVANQAGINFISVKGPELLNMVGFHILTISQMVFTLIKSLFAVCWWERKSRSSGISTSQKFFSVCDIFRWAGCPVSKKK